MKMLKRQIGKNCKAFLLMLIAAFLLGSIIIPDTSVLMAAGETEAEPEEIESRSQKLRYIQIIKVDSSDVSIRLEGAEFELTDSRGEVVSSGTTDENGLLRLSGLHPGNNYTLRETKAPEGYEGTPLFEATVSLSANDTLQTFYAANEKQILPEIRYGYIEIYKIDAAGRPAALAGAKFSVLNSAGEVVASGTTDTQGYLKLEGLELNQRFTLKETKALEGGQTTVLYEKEFVLTEEEQSFTFEVKNQPIEDPKSPEDPKDPEDPGDPDTPEDPEDPEDPDTPEAPKGPENPGTAGGGLQIGGRSGNQIKPLSFAKGLHYTPLIWPQTAAANKETEEAAAAEREEPQQAAGDTEVSAPESAEQRVGGSREEATSIRGILGQYAYIGVFGAGTVAAALFGLSIGYDIRTLVWYREKKKQARKRFKRNRR